MASDSNRGEGMPVDFASLLRHVDELIETSERNLNAVLRTAPLDFRQQNFLLAEYQAAVRAREVLLGRTSIDGHELAHKAPVKTAAVDAVAAVLGRGPSRPAAVPHADDGAAAMAKKFAPPGRASA